MPTPTEVGESKPVSAWPGQEFSCCSAGGPWPAFRRASVILSVRPSQPPTRCRPIRVSGSSAATITKNCSTSL